MMAVATYICTWQFYAMWWFLLGLADLIVGIIFLIAFARSIISETANQRKYNHSYVPILIYIATVAIIICLPPIDSNKRYLKYTGNACTRIDSNCACDLNLYIKTYTIFGSGAWGGDLNAVYLTDYVNFRVLLGEVDEAYEQVKIKCNGNHLIILKTTTDGINTQLTTPIT
ncbi:MAG: hypothetical protein EOP47_29900, partial [Sphingobacteriaceae bacterium]